MGNRVASIRLVASCGEDLDARTDAERSELADALPAHHRTSFPPGTRTLSRICPSILPDPQKVSVGFLQSHSVPVVLYLNGVAVALHLPRCPVLACQKRSERDSNYDVLRVRVVRVGDELSDNSAYAIIQADPQLIDRHARNPHNVAIGAGAISHSSILSEWAKRLRPPRTEGCLDEKGLSIDNVRDAADASAAWRRDSRRRLRVASAAARPASI